MPEYVGKKRRSLASYEYERITAAAVWEIEHQLGRYPAVSVTNADGEQVLAKVENLSPGQVKLTFGEALAGRAILH